jgi:hypothetical protein
MFTEDLNGIPQSLQANVGIEPYLDYGHFLRNPFPVHHPLAL